MRWTAWNRAAAAASISLCCLPAWGTAVYSAGARSTFTLDPASPVSSITDHAPFTATATVGVAVASIDTFIASADGVYPVTVDSKVSGSASAPPPSLSSSFAEAKRGHVLVVPRVSPAGPLPTITMRFSFEISWDVDLSITRIGSEFTSGGAYFALSGFEDGIDTLALDPGMPGELVDLFPDGSKGWQFNPRYLEFDGSPVDELHSTTITGSITVLAGRVGAWSVITDTAGSAVSLPEPGTVALTLLALAAASRRTRPGARG